MILHLSERIDVGLIGERLILNSVARVGRRGAEGDPHRPGGDAHPDNDPRRRPNETGRSLCIGLGRCRNHDVGRRRRGCCQRRRKQRSSEPVERPAPVFGRTGKIDGALRQRAPGDIHPLRYDANLGHAADQPNEHEVGGRRPRGDFTDASGPRRPSATSRCEGIIDANGHRGPFCGRVREPFRNQRCVAKRKIDDLFEVNTEPSGGDERSEHHGRHGRRLPAALADGKSLATPARPRTVGGVSTVVITGANRGIGLEMTRQFHSRGDGVIAVCRKSSPDLDAVGVRVMDGIDVCDDASVQALHDRLDGVQIDVLINNAGVLIVDSLPGIDLAGVQRQLEVNAIGPLRVTQTLLPRLHAGSKVGIITSRMGSIADNTSGGMYGYRMSKAAVNAAGKSLAQDLQPKSIAVQLLHPGFVQTEMTNGAGNVTPAESAADLIKRIDELDLASTGTFRHANGEMLAW